MNYPLQASYTELKRYAVRLRRELENTDPAATGTAMFWLYAIDGVLNYMEEELRNESN